MKKLNYRHSLDTMNKELSKYDERITHTMQDGKDLFTLSERVDNEAYEWRTCGHYYHASDVAEYINKRNGIA